MKILDGGRISIAALSLGIAKGAYDASVKYSNERYQLMCRFPASREFLLRLLIWLRK
jgi:alkylation response protein AidB-like acyl-CoA dehydrogenase